MIAGRFAHRWERFHEQRWPVRRAVKIALFAAVVLLTLYPKVWLIPTWIGRITNLNAVIDPNEAHLTALAAQVRTVAPAGAPLELVHLHVERAVYAAVPYAFDWETWGVADYLPTVAEVFAKGREDCDGRAVVAASLLRRLGYSAWLATDLKHMWVVARATATQPVVELMGPGQGAKTIVADQAGTHARISLETVENVARGLSYGVGVFPVTRELIIWAALCAVSTHPWSTSPRRIVGSVLIAVALVLVRAAGTEASALATRPLLVWLALAVALGGWLVLLIRVRAPHVPGQTVR